MALKTTMFININMLNTTGILWKRNVSFSKKNEFTRKRAITFYGVKMLVLMNNCGENNGSISIMLERFKVELHFDTKY